MRMSCNGCRVLRKGCSENCSIRPCLQWIKNPESQANATVFLAKFYGRAGLMNLIHAGADHLRPAIFRSLLYEACGRIVNPIYGSVGLLWSGNWQLCQAAVEAVLKGAPVLQLAGETATDTPFPLLHKAMLSSYDIRHVSRVDDAASHLLLATAGASAASHDLHRLNRASRSLFKRSGANHSADGVRPAGAVRSDPRPFPTEGHPPPAAIHLHWRQGYAGDAQWTPIHESSASERPEPNSAGSAAAATRAAGGAAAHPGDDNRENESVFSVETVEASMVTSQGADAGKGADDRASGDSEVELELTLGLERVRHSHSPRGSSSGHSPTPTVFCPNEPDLPNSCDRMTRVDGWPVEATGVDLGLNLPA